MAGAEVIRRLSAEDRRVRRLRLAANAGASAALDAAFSRVRGRCVTIMDTDFHDDPNDIPARLAHLAHVDVPVARPVICRPAGRLRSSSYIVDVDRISLPRPWLPARGHGFYAIRRSCLDDLELYSGTHDFIPILLATAGYRIVEVSVTDHRRHARRTPMGIGRRMWQGVRDACVARCIVARRLSYQIEEGPPPEETHGDSFVLRADECGTRNLQ